MGRRVYVRLSAVSVCVYFCNNWGLFASFEGSIKQGGGGGGGGVTAFLGLRMKI